MEDYNDSDEKEKQLLNKDNDQNSGDHQDDHQDEREEKDEIG